MNVNQDRRPGSFFRIRTWVTIVSTSGVLMTAGPLGAQANKKPFGPEKPTGDQAEWLKRLDEMTSRTEQSRKSVPLPPGGAPPPPSPGSPTAPPSGPAPSAPAAPGTGLRPPAPPAPAAAPETPELFEDDFDRTAVVSYAHRRMVLLVFAPQPETDAWRTSPDILPWAQRVVICPVHQGAQGDRAARLAKAFGIDPTAGGMLTALVRAPDGALQVTGDQLLYQVLGRYPAPADAVEVVRVMQEGVAAYDVKKTQYVWDATLPPGTAPPPLAAAAAIPQGMTSPLPSSTGTTAPVPPAPPAPAPRSAFEKAALSAWTSRKPMVLLFPGNEPFDKAKLAEAWRVVPEVLAPELLVLTPGSTDGSIGGKPVNWEEFFDVGGRYPHAVMILPEHAEGETAPKVADMSYRVIARQHGDFSPETVPLLARKWMFEDYDAVMMRAWVLGRPMLLVFPPPDDERGLLGPALAKLEERVAVFVNTKGSVSGIRRKTSEQLDKEFASEGVERAELVLLKLTTKLPDPTSVRLDQIQLNPVNRALAKKTPEKILEWVTSRVPAKPTRAQPGN